MSLLQQIYFKAPYRAKCWMANEKARRESRLRFSDDYEQLKREIHARDSWTREQFEDYQLVRIKELVAHAAAHVPYYRELFKSVGLEPGDIKTLQDIQGIPVLEKEVLRERGDDLVDERLDKKRLLFGVTSGTTGAKTRVYRTAREYSAAFAYNAVRLWSVAGVERGVDKSVSIGGSLVVAPKRQKPPFWVHVAPWKQLYMSSLHMSSNTLGYYVHEIERFGPLYMEGYPSAVSRLAKYIVDNGIESVALSAVFTTGEKLWPEDRGVIEKAFGCSVYDQYGCVEQAVNATECRHGNMHVNPDHSLVEVVDGSNMSVEFDEVGHVIGTSLERFAQPLIRYRVGDLASFSSSTCSCGSFRPLLGNIDGRANDMIVTSDGRYITSIAVGAVIRQVKGISEAQLIQRDINSFLVRVVGYNIDTNKVKEKLEDRLGISNGVEVMVVDRIAKEKSGKFKMVVSEINK